MDEGEHMSWIAWVVTGIVAVNAVFFGMLWIIVSIEEWKKRRGKHE